MFDSQPDVEQTQERGNQSIIVDMGKGLAAMLVCAIVSGICATISFTVWRAYHDDAVDVQDQYQKERNHVIELEARLHTLTEQVEEMNRVRR